MLCAQAFEFALGYCAGALPGVRATVERETERRHPEVAYEAQKQSQFTVLVRGTTRGSTVTCRIDGRDGYALTGRIAAQVTVWACSRRSAHSMRGWFSIRS